MMTIVVEIKKISQNEISGAIFMKGELPRPVTIY